MKAWIIAKKEFRDVMREKSLVTAFMIQLFLAGFSALLLAGLTALYSPDAIDAAPRANVAYVGPGGMLELLDETRNIEVFFLTGADAVDAFEGGAVDAIIEEQYLDEQEVRDITIILPDGELTSTLLITQLKAILLEYENELRSERSPRLTVIDNLPEPINVQADTPYAFIYSTLIPLLVITPVFLSGAIAADALSQESRSRTLLILRSTPVSTSQLVIGKLIVPVLLVPIQVTVWIALFALNGFGTVEPWTVIAFATMMGIFLTGTGGIIAALVRDESTTQAAYAILVLSMAVFSLTLPRDPLNIVALMTTGVTDALAWQAVGMLAVATVVGLGAAIVVTSRRIRRDLL